MNNIFKTLAVTALTFSTNSAVMANNDLIDFSALTGEYVSSNPGFEAVVPFWTQVDSDADGVEDGYDFHFDVYKSGTKTKLFSTPVQYLPYFLSACRLDTPMISTFFNSKDIDFKRIGNNIVLSTDFKIECAQGTKYTGHVYAANISAAGKTPWVKSFSGKLIGTGILPDKNGNHIGELSVVIETGTSNNNDNSDNTNYVYDGETGASLSTPQKYAIEH